MAITMEQLQKLLDGENYHYLVDPKRPMVMLGVKGINGSYQCFLSIDLDGKFLQFRMIQYASCPVGHPHLPRVLQTLAELNYLKRLVKFAWDSNDGEITAYADIWLETDGTLTQLQFSSNLQTFLSVADHGYRRIHQAIETGKDPGEATSSEDMSEI